MIEFEVSGHRFRAEKLNVLKQGHLSRKLAPLLPPLAPIVERAVADKDLLNAKVFEYLVMAQPFADALSMMKDEDFEDVLNLTLGSVQVQTAEATWMPLWVKSTGLTMLEDLNSIGKLLPVVIKVVVYNLGDFMDGLLTRRLEPQPVVAAVAKSGGARSPAAKTGS